jgi:F-type H+-transporting ATPase subunit delta
MNEGLISVRYAKALFSLAKENNLLTSLKDDMELILSVYNGSADFKRMLGTPVIKPSEKISVFHAVFNKKINPVSMNFLELVVRNNRETFIAPVCRNVLTFIRKEKNIKTAVITTAWELDKETLAKAEKVLEKELGTQVELTGKTNPNLIGGLVLRVDDQQYDATVATQLKKLKQEFLKAQV